MDGYTCMYKYVIDERMKISEWMYLYLGIYGRLIDGCLK